MSHPEHDLPSLSTCTSCQFTEDFSNYWTAVLYFRARNGTYKRVPQIAQAGMEGTQGGMVCLSPLPRRSISKPLTKSLPQVVYYMSDALFDTAQKSTVTAFKPGFRMLIGEASYTTRDQSRDFRQLTYTCMENQASRSPESIGFRKTPCKLGIMANHRFPTCWDGVNLDTPNHRDHVAYPETGTFESGGKCPSTHPVKIPQILLETVWDTSAFNKKEDWPADGSQPFVWSNGDASGFGFVFPFPLLSRLPSYLAPP